jgi:hypothetical protein
VAGVDILVSAIGYNDLLQQRSLVRAAKEAGVKRFVPCAFITICPPKGVMLLRDEVLCPLPFPRMGGRFWCEKY